MPHSLCKVSLLLRIGLPDAFLVRAAPAPAVEPNAVRPRNARSVPLPKHSIRLDWRAVPNRRRVPAVTILLGLGVEVYACAVVDPGFHRRLLQLVVLVGVRLLGLGLLLHLLLQLHLERR